MHDPQKDPKAGAGGRDDRLSLGAVLPSDPASVQHVQEQASQHRRQDRLRAEKERELVRADPGDLVGAVEARWRGCVYQYQVYDPHLRELHVLNNTHISTIPSI